MNSFTQGIARDVAVVFHDDNTRNGESDDDNSEAGASQKVEYFHTQIKSQSEMAKALNISAALAINVGGIQGTGAGNFVNEEKANKADCNFLLRCVVRNHHNVKQRMEFKWDENPKTETEFLKSYGDSFVYRLVEGGEFVAVVSINTEDSSSVQKIAAELQVAFSAVSAGGKGQYDLSTMKKLSNITVSVQYSGAMNVNPDAKEWDIDLMLKEAAGFPAKCSKARTPIRALLMKYTALADFQKLKLPCSPPSYDKANSMASTMFDDSQSLKQLRSVVDQTIARLLSGQLTKEQLSESPVDNSYPPTEQGLVMARNDIDKAIEAIKSVTEALTASPPQLDDKKKPTQVAGYLKADAIQSRLPAEKGNTGAATPHAVVGSSLAAVHFVDNGVHTLQLYWQQSDNAIVQASYKGAVWLPTLTTVVSEAAANTPIAVTASSAGEEIRLFYLDSSSRMADAVIQAGDKKFSDGGLSSSPLATLASAWRLRMRRSNLRLARTPMGSDSRWPNGAVAALGSGLAALITKVDATAGTTSMSLFLQNSKDAALEEWRFDPQGMWAASWGWVPQLLAPNRVFQTALPIGAGVCAFMDGATANIAALSRSNNVIVASFDASKNTWNAPKGIFSDGTRSSGLAVLAWNEENGDAVKRAYMQVQGGTSDACELCWDANMRVWSESASPVTLNSEKKKDK
ncbi:hypothetical protein FGADI_12330 [Fusarium gaditjirri]|uniref:Fucose-specific lectin n=1 Tax=Fusarium gaditjirri TaxID=282569 RepID=A0A8H4ST10_9HYPO|nr:hypothetical protein FGADI_12330 [Fusarium gaditjirri]